MYNYGKVKTECMTQVHEEYHSKGKANGRHLERHKTSFYVILLLPKSQSWAAIYTVFLYRIGDWYVYFSRNFFSLQKAELINYIFCLFPPFYNILASVSVVVCSQTLQDLWDFFSNYLLLPFGATNMQSCPV